MAMGLMIMVHTYINYGIDFSNNENFFLYLWSLGFLILGVFVIIMLQWRGQKIVVYDDHLKIGKKVFKLDQIRGVKLTGLQPSSLLFGELEGMHIKLFSGKSFYLHDNLYKGLHHLKMFLDNKMTKVDKEDQPRNRENLEPVHFVFDPKFYHDQLMLMLYIVFFLGIIFLILSPHFKWTALFYMSASALPVTSLIFIVRSRYFSKVEITNEAVTFKKKINGKVKETISVQSIREIAALNKNESQDERGILLVQDDFQTHTIYLLGLKTSDAQVIISCFKSLGIPLRSGLSEWTL